ncbi:unnamed protein product [Urochloa humidicola]
MCSVNASSISIPHATLLPAKSKRPQNKQSQLKYYTRSTCARGAAICVPFQVIPSMQLHTSKKCTKKESINMTIVKLGKLN